MLETYFSASKTLKRLRIGPSAPYIDDFASWLTESGYSSASAVRYLRAAAHLGHFLNTQGVTFIDIDSGIADAFRQHLSGCRCPSSNGGRINHHAFYGVKCFRQYLQNIGVCPSDPICTVELDEPVLICEFRYWLAHHRGATESTIKLYSRYADELIKSLGKETRLWGPHNVRTYFFNNVSRCGAATKEKKVTSVRAFLRFLIVKDQCRADLDQAVPTLAHWRLATLPRSLTPTQVTQLVDACEGNSPRRVRDRAIAATSWAASQRCCQNADNRS